MAALDTERWALELFFKALQPSLRGKTFVGTSANALQTQIWAARIALLLLKYLPLRSTFSGSLSNWVARLRQPLFVDRDLWTWMDAPFPPPPQPELRPEPRALALASSDNCSNQIGQQKEPARRTERRRSEHPARSEGGNRDSRHGRPPIL
jgi:hypothetical protein